MLDVINRYLHGFVTVPVILACRKKGLFELLQHQGSLTREQIVESLGANGGHLQVALRMMRSLNWLERNEVGQYSLTDEAQLHKKIPEEILDLYHLPIESYLIGEQPSGLLKNWISRSIQRWNVDDLMMADFLDGILVIPILRALHKHNLLVEDEQKPLFSQLSDPVRDPLYELFISKGWALRQEGNHYLTNVGRFIAERALIIGVTASYTPMLSRMPEILFGDCFSVFRRDASGHESHVERTLNVVASGFQHEKYFADVEDIILSIFNQLPIEEQPKYFVDMGCGDGTLLKRVYETIQSKSARGKVLHQYPLCAIGVDYNEASITATARTLAKIPHLVLKGDIGDPEQMITSLKSHGIHDPENILHIRSFLDHDRPYIPPQNLEQVQVRSHIPYQGVYVGPSGELIPPHIMMQSLVEHLERWSKVVTKQGLIILEVHCLEPDVVNRFLSHSENLHFDAIQAFSMQHLVEADVFLMAAAEVGLFPKFEFSKRYPKTFPFTRITLNCFEKRPYKIRHPQLSDLPALVNLEAKCWPKHLRASSDEIQQRIERFPNGHCLLEIDSIVVGVIYSQRISCADALKNTSYAEVPSLHTSLGSIIQLLAINILPEMQDKGLGDQLREFMLQLCTLKGGIERVVGVTRCKNYVSHAHIPIEEYIHQRNELGQLLDPILRFHSEARATIKGIIPNYRPEDVDNLGNGVAIEYDIHNHLQFNSDKAFKMESVPKRQKIGLKENETLDNLIEECIHFVLGSHRSAAFARSRPLMEMGLDSLELLELRTLMSQRLEVELEPTFFFQYGTTDAIARYFQGTEGEDVCTALPNLDEPENSGENNSDLSELIDNSEDLIAIIGMSCRFPGGINNPAQYWSVLRHGINAIVEVPSYRWNINHYYAPDPKQPGKISSKYGGFLEQVDQFDAPFFRISPREAAFIDPQQRILLEETWTALENAGIHPESLSGSQTGVFVGIFSHDYELLQVKSNSPYDFDAYFGTGNSASIAAGRLSYFFGFTGPALAVDTACSSSLVAVHLASQSLLRGECDLAVASGVNLLLSPELSIAFSQAGMLSPDGQCKTFDASANGYVRSEGCGVVVLKRLKKALADHDNILAVVRGTAINQDGTSSGLTAPNERSQEAVIQKALSMAKVSPSEVSYVEAHGTGTSLGDPIEVKALEAVYGQQRDKDNPLVIGSVKTNIGHAEAAAGMAGLIKVVLSMQNKYIPPHLHFKQLNPHMTLSGIPAVIPTVGMEWKRPQSGRRLAGVSSFGFSGTNAHVVLEEAPVRARVQARFERNRHLLTISAKSNKALLELAQRYEDFFATHPESSLADVCFTANTGRSHFEYRLAVVAESNLQLQDELSAFATGKETFKLVSGQQNRNNPPKIAFLFTGQGSQYIGMGRQLYEFSPTFRQTLDRCDSIVRPYLDEPLLSVLYPEPGKTSPINETAYTQPALFALEYALHQLWQSWGIKPTAVMGHSVGEYVAATVAGVFSLEDGLKLMAARGRLMQALPQNGEMVAVLASERQVAPVIEPYLQEVAIAALNGPESVVISGKRSTIRLVVAQLEAMGIKTTPLQVSHAFHSPLIEPMLEEFARVASEVTYSPPKTNLISNVTGELVEAEVATPEYWCRHVRCSVQFAAGMEALYRAGYEVFVECGPKPVLLGMGRRCLPEGLGRWLPSLRPGQEDWQQILQSLAQLYVEGVQVDWSGFDQDYERRKVALPTYPFQRQRYWIKTAQKPSIQNQQSQIQHAVNPSYWLQQVDSTMNGDSAVNENKLGAKMDASVTTNRRDEIAASLQTLVGNLIEVSPAEVNIDSSFLEMGADSIILVEAVRRIENTYGIKIAIRQLFEELTTINTLATYINQNLSQQWIEPDFRQSNPQVQSQQLEQPISTQSIPKLSLHNTQNFEHRGIVSAETTLERIMTQQLQVMSQQSQIISELMSQQLEVLRGNGSYSKSLLSQNEQLQSTQTITPAVDSPHKEQCNQISQATPSSSPAKSELRQPSHQPFSALSSVPSADIQGKELNRRQQHHLEILSTRYNKRHQKSRQLAQTYRPVLADSRAIINFRLSIKEILYPIAGERAQGSRFWDVDGNEYVDLTMGFGVFLFGHAPQFVTEAVQKHYQQGLKIGPQSKLAGEVAQLISELTGMERVAFCNSGTEAVMTALRLARSATGRTKIALFAGSYHGHFDGILATASTSQIKAVPMASGVSQNFVEDVLVLDYGNSKSLEILQVHAQELAAVLVEPVQSRRPDLQPKEFLQQLRQLTQASGTALIFDEILTGFRIHPGGAQTWFDIEADIATYGKIIGGGTPIGVVAGKATYMNGIDGGLWNYGDASYPLAEKIFFGGTFNKNHTGMVAALAVLQHLKKQGPALQQQLNQRTSQLALILNSYFEEEDVPIRVVHFGSMFRFTFSGNQDLFFYHLLDKGVYIWEGRTCFLSTAHTDADINHVIQAVKDSVKELREGGFLPSASSKLLKTDKNTNETSNDLTPAFSDKNFTPSALSSDTQQTIDVEASKELTRLRVSQDECLLRDYMPTASEIGERLLSEFAQVTCQQNIKVYGEAVAQLEALSITYVLRAFQQMGWEFQPSERFSTKFIVEQLSIIEQHQRLLKRLLEMLTEEKVLRQVDDDCWEATQIVEIQNSQAQEIAFLAQYPEAKVELTLLQRCGQKLAQVLQGEYHPLELLFPKGNLTTLTKLYQDSPEFQVMNTLVQKAVSGVLERLPHKCRVRILEIGGGTGATTSYILPQLLDHQAEYVFTDLSPILISKAKKKFGDYPFVCCQILDIEQDPETQAYDFGQYDLIIAANVLHATKDLHQTLKHIQQLLAPGGLLLLVEITVRQRWLDLTFGLTEGWWKFADRDLRPSYPLLSTAQWQELLSESGFREVALIPTQEQLSVLSQQAVIVAELARKVSLNEAQKQLGILAQTSEDGSVAYNVSISLELKGSFQLAAMRKAVKTVVNRHEALRTIISSQNDFQEILPSLTADVTLVDFSNGGDAYDELRRSERELQVADWLKKESQEPFDLSNGPLFRFSILKLEEKIHLLVLTIHHIVIDGWSLGVILRELGALYSAECQGVVCRLEPPMQFQEYIEWQEKQSQTEAMAAHESYWLEQFAESIPVLDLPTDRPRPPIKTYKGSRQTRRLNVSLTREVKRFSTENGCTLLMTLLSVYTTLLHRLTGQNEIIVGMPTAARSLEGSEKLVGYCAHILPVRSCIVGSESFLEYLKTLKNRLLEIYEHQDYPFVRLLDKLNVARDAIRSPLVTAIFNWDRPVTVPKMFKLATDLFPQPISCTPYDISLNVMEVMGELVLDCDYNTDLCDASTIERWLNHFQTLLEGVVANPQQCIVE